MPAQPHSRDAYIYAFHRLYCDAAPLEKVAEEVGVHPTILFKAATGYSNGKDGAIGRAIFITWLKGLRSPNGAPCCRAHVTKGKRLLVRTPQAQAGVAQLKSLEAEAARVMSALEHLRQQLGEGTTHDPPEQDALPLDDARR